LKWFEEKTLGTEDMVQEVDMAAKEIKPETHPMCLERHLNLELARTSRVTSSPLAQETRAKMETCFACPGKRWQYTSEPSTVTMWPKNGPVKSVLCSRSLPNHQQLRQGTQKEYRQPESNSIKKIPESWLCRKRF
jgi:hypothetical protein